MDSRSRNFAHGLATAFLALALPTLAGAQTWIPVGPPGGDVRALAADPRDPRRIYLGTADGVGRYLMVTAGKIGQRQRLSPRFIWMASKETDEFSNRPTSFVEESGTSLKAAMDIARRYGFALERDLPFEVDTAMFTGVENAFYAKAAQRRISYVNLGLDLQRWKRWLVNKGLASGDRLIVEGTDKVRVGQVVKPVPVSEPEGTRMGGLQPPGGAEARAAQPEP